MRYVSPFVVILAFVACAQPSVPAGEDGGADAGVSTTGNTKGVLSSCRECVSTTDCSGIEVCVQLSPATVCVAPCLFDSDCAPEDHCVPVVTEAGKKVSACVARNGACGMMQQSTGGNDAGTTTSGGMDAGTTTSGGMDAGMPMDNCNLYVAPQTKAGCTCKAGKTCGPNGCYGGAYCDTNLNPPLCKILPQTCGGPPPLTDALSTGGPVAANINPKTGGTMDRLLFAVVGDTRPATINDTANYPTSVINGIYAKLASASPKPAFVIATGDYAFATPGGTEAVSQYNIYLNALKQVNLPFWPVMGNHECDGNTSSNCFPGGGSGNIDDWISTMLKPHTDENKPYYERDVNATDGSWTAKFIFLAPNSWDSTQSSFLKQQLARKSTYTFVIRHEPSVADTLAGSTMAPGTSAIDSLLKGQAVTLVIEGHSHTWFFYDYTDATDATEVFPKEVIVGNGGAPMTTVHPLGYTIIAQRTADNAIVVSNYDYTTGMEQYSIALKPDGSKVP